VIATTGKAVAYLAAAGHRVMNVDRVPLNHPGVHDLIADLDGGDIKTPGDDILGKGAVF
jgi:hypothetical protein